MASAGNDASVCLVILQYGLKMFAVRLLMHSIRIFKKNRRNLLLLWLFISSGTPIRDSGEEIGDKINGDVGKGKSYVFD